MDQTIENIKNVIGNLSDIFSIAGILLSVILAIIFVILIPSKINKDSKKILENNKKNNKYIPSIYVEIDDYAERLRCFSYRKMKKKLYLRYIKILSDNHGKFIRKTAGINYIEFKRKSLMNKNINLILRTVEEIDNSENLKSYHRHCFSMHKRELIDIQKKLNLYNEKIIFLKGNAGTGKTNLICSYVESLMKNKENVIYINAKDITVDIDTYLKQNYFKADSIFKKIFFWLSTSVKKLFRKKVFFVIDGINENNKECFGKDICDFLLDNQKEYKFLISLREEYFSMFFKNILKSYNFKYDIIDVRPPNFKNKDYKILISKYKNWFDFKGKITEKTYQIITKSLFLTRLFFEAFRETNICVDLNNINHLFSKYIEELNKSNPKSALLLTNICKKMLNNNKYDFILYDDLYSEGYTKEEIDKLSLENITISSKTEVQRDVLSISKMFIQFNFDELRDFLLAYEISKLKTPILFLNSLFQNNSVVKEGVYKYLYLRYKSQNNYNAISKMHHILNVDKCYVYRHNSIYSYGMVFDCILSSDSKLYTSEMAYILTVANKNDFSQIIKGLAINELNGVEPSLTCFVEALQSFGNIEHLIDDGDYKLFNNIITELKKINVDNKTINFLILCLNHMKTPIVDSQYNESDYYNDQDFKNKIGYNYYLIVKKHMNKKNFISLFNVQKGSYFYNLLIRVYNNFYACNWSIYKEYKKFYKKEFPEFEDYLNQVLKLFPNSIDRTLKKNLYLKYQFSWEDNSVYNFLCYPLMKDTFEKIMEEEYYDCQKWFSNK